MKNKKILTLIAYMLIPVLIIAGLSYYASFQKQEKLEYYEVVELFDEHKIEEYTLNMSSGNLKFKIKGEAKDRSFTVPNISMFQEDIHDGVIEYNRNLAEGQTPIKAKYQTGTAGMMLINIVPSLLMFIVLGGLLFFMFRRMNQTMSNETNRTLSFGKAKVKRAKDEKRKTTFDDVAGADEEKEELSEIVEFLKNPARFNSLGARIPRGVLLVGPPGTGKTLLAKAVAGEAGVPFFSISGSDFVEMYVGVGASRVRDLFETAKKSSPSIVFIDEIDAVGRHRGAGLGGGHDEREQTLNQLLVEMDGFGVNDGVIVIAATNRPDILDPALLRPGRFDRQVTVNYPDIHGREEILKVHARNKPFENDVDLSTIAKTTVGFTGADLANLLNEAALLAARRGKRLIGMKDIEEASIKIIVGTSKKSLKRNELETKMVAYHEAGHAIIHYVLPTLDPVQQISIIPTARTGGYTLSIPQEDHYLTSRKHMQEEIVSLLGGRVAEYLIFDDFTTGASNDIQRATNLARNMVTRYGMSSKLGSVVYGSEHSNDEVFLGRDFSSSKNYSEKTAADIDEEIRLIVDNAYAQCTEIIRDNIDKLHFISEYLIANEIMDEEQFKVAMSTDATLEDLVAIRDRKAEQSKTENAKRAEEDRQRAEDERNRAEEARQDSENEVRF